MKLFEAIEILSAAGIEDAAHDARVIFEKIGGVPKSQLVFRDAESTCESISSAVS